MQEYSCAFIYRTGFGTLPQVLLVEKGHGPEAVIGKWNGVGGKILTDETPREGMIRELEEETSLRYLDHYVDLHHFYSLTDPKGEWRVYFYRAVMNTMVPEDFVPDLNDANEPLRWHTVGRNLDYVNMVPNLRWLLPMSRDPDTWMR